MDFGQWMNSFIISDNICSLTHKKCHLESSYSNSKYRMTVNITFSVVTDEPVEFEKYWSKFKTSGKNYQSLERTL
jgi:predicted 3-demethylubiquinone-9 3-methyltransferase (glyoxalase superfamily)